MREADKTKILAFTRFGLNLDFAMGITNCVMPDDIARRHFALDSLTITPH